MEIRGRIEFDRFKFRRKFNVEGMLEEFEKQMTPLDEDASDADKKNAAEDLVDRVLDFIYEYVEDSADDFYYEALPTIQDLHIDAESIEAIRHAAFAIVNRTPTPDPNQGTLHL